MFRPSVIGAVWLVLVAASGKAEENRPWAADMARFEKADAENPPPAGGVVFVGSSSIRLWDLAKSFGPDSPAPLGAPLLNRGFGGSQIADSVREIDLLVLKHEPRQVVLYAGDNDIAAGKSPQTVAEDFDRFVAAVRSESSDIPIAFISIKPSIARRALADAMHDANRRIRQRCRTDDRLTYIDIWTPMLGADGEPRSELFAGDGLHLSDAGYQLWAAEVARALRD